MGADPLITNHKGYTVKDMIDHVNDKYGYLLIEHGADYRTRNNDMTTKRRRTSGNQITFLWFIEEYESLNELNKVNIL